MVELKVCDGCGKPIRGDIWELRIIRGFSHNYRHFHHSECMRKWLDKLEKRRKALEELEKEELQ
jgi:hypothetical protein